MSLNDGARYCEPQLRELARARPDVIVEDNVSGFPALLTHGAPWVRTMSCNPLEIRNPNFPTFSGYPIDDPSGWEEFRAEYDRTHRELWSGFNEWMLEQGAPALPDFDFIHESDHLNLSIYPDAADYLRTRPLDPRGIGSNPRCAIPRSRGPCPNLSSTATDLVYLSLGSLDRPTST